MSFIITKESTMRKLECSNLIEIFLIVAVRFGLIIGTIGAFFEIAPKYKWIMIKFCNYLSLKSLAYI